ncbi:MAG: tyrosine-type recombinase/integrase [Clostridia bacterium]|nr:tyrosine-type recombinase/integrase [Clostridia bacterium]MBQ8836459.1 tyrosine-type recombinase/integrase [Clostridia bacterium]
MICKKCKNEIEDDSVYCRYCGKKLLSTPKPKKLKRANGMGTITKLPGRRRKPYLVRIYVDRDGERQRITYGTYATKTEAEIALDNINIKGNVTALFKVTFGEAYRMWSETHFATLTPKGIGTYEMAWRFLRPLENTRLSDIKTQQIQEILNKAVEQGKSHSTVSKIALLASKICQWGVQNDVIDKDYAVFCSVTAKKPPSKERFSDEEIEALRKHYDATQDLRIGVVLFLCYTGLRIDEFLSLKKNDYYDGCLHGGNKTEKGKNRVIPIPDSVAMILERLLNSEGEYLYSSATGSKFNSENFRKRVYYKALESAGYTEEQIKKRNPHTCRHTFASMCAKKGVDPKALQDIIGHKQIETTLNTYTHTDTEWLKNAIKDL